jgi:hypothetical protein
MIAELSFLPDCKQTHSNYSNSCGRDVSDRRFTFHNDWWRSGPVDDLRAILLPHNFAFSGAKTGQYLTLLVKMKLVPVSKDDLALYESMFCDPVHMADLGGVQPREKVGQCIVDRFSHDNHV